MDDGRNEKNSEERLKMENEDLGRPDPELELAPEDIVPVANESAGPSETTDGFLLDQSDFIGMDGTPDPPSLFDGPVPASGGSKTENDGPAHIIDQSDLITMEEKEDHSSLPGGFATRSFEPGDVIFREGDPGDAAYLILSGLVKITRQQKKTRLVLNQLGADQIFGEMAMITGEPRTATATALEPTEVFVITEERLNENLSQHLAIVKNLIDQLIERMKQLLQHQSAMMEKMARSAAGAKRMEKLKALAAQYEKTVPPEKLDKGLKALLKMVQEI
ncbi:Crp/Fnr family transcriptional regulator [Desulfosudis oleivorans]|uniref:Cyclic nucleotide-binding protein n=1 Tax=Desulfosudis oleivorans (strain DSM 6200 / JCM 39069 / Hxd3) TaxID=96561 RepID=A8ZSE5_DESOH|nr:cyclic nucleotide-binding domain-containing protein [Desulfosudis oleivorans]ABW67682.1 cyclic nucleotide-binding protein [Desulfosudis oleivorans Hxd3]